MIQEIIDEIKAAEAQAELITSHALSEAGRINLEADDECARIIKDARELVKSRRLEIIKLAEKEATIQCDALIKEGLSKASEISGKARIEEASEFIVEKLLEKYVSR
ncbi:MAG: hypothetical protein LBF12_03255 [Christensenellaceae bacterium]|jgi:vacuolar-type H+-ATPase subunit H|nr:hypothetical protein [Christensenellaceae bacterium]